MKIKQITETTTAGSIATVNSPLGGTQSRGNPSIYGGKKVGTLFKGKKTSAPYANSINESAELSEAHLEEDDVIVVPGQGRKTKTGFVPHGQSRVDHEVEMARSDLFQAAKNAQQVFSMIKDVSEDQGLDGWVQEKIIKANDYLNTVREYLEGKQTQGVTEGTDNVDSLVTDTETVMKKFKMDATQELTTQALKIVLGEREYKDRPGYYYSFIRQIIARSKQQGVAEAGFPGAPDVEMPPMKPSGDPQRDKLKQEYMDLHSEIKSLVDIPYSSDSSPKQKMQAKARIKQLNDRADQIKAILEPRLPPNEWQKKTYGYDDNWNIVKKGVAEGSNPEKVEVRFSAKEYAAMSPAQKAAKQEEWQQLKQQAKMRMQNFTLIDTDKEQGVAEGYDPVESDYQQWEDILVKDGYRGDPSGAYALKLVVGHQLMLDPAEVASTIRNILTYVKQNRQVLGKAVSDRTTVKDAIIDIKNKFPQQYQAAQQPQGVAEGKRNLKCVCKTHGTMQCPVHTPKDIEVIEGAKVDRMVKHVAQSEKKLGHSKKEAENIAWATANKRGMLNNKNKTA